MKVIFFTAFAPFGGGEVFSVDEIISLKNNELMPIVVPRSFGRVISHKKSLSLLDNTLNYKIFDPKGMACLLIYFFKSPIKFFKIIYWNWSWAWNTAEFIKSLIVMPKAYRVAWHCKEMNIDHIHCTNTNSMMPMAYLLSQCLSVPWSFTLHSWWPSFSKRKSNFEVSISSASFCRVISRHACSQLTGLITDSLHQKCIPIHIGTQCSMKPVTTFPNDKFVIVTAANVETHKGPGIAIAAAKILLDQGIKNFHWFFFGEGSLRNSLEADLYRLGLAEYFSFPGLISNDELLEKYCAGDVHIFALPSLEKTGMPEGIPHALIQAAGFGIPIVSTDSGGTTELSGNGAGFVVRQGNAEELAAAISLLMSSKTIYEEKANMGLRKIQAEFDNEVCINKLLVLFSKYSANQ